MPDPLLRGVSMWRIYVPSVMTDLDFFPFFFFRFFFFSSSFRRTKVFFSLSPTAWRFQHDVGHISKTLFAKDTFFTRSVFSLPLHARVCVFVDANYVLAALCTHKDEEKRVRRRREKRERERERKGLKTIREQRLKGPSWCLNDPSVTTKYQPERQTC